jgi:hypothetical protein
MARRARQQIKESQEAGIKYMRVGRLRDHCLVVLGAQRGLGGGAGTATVDKTQGASKLKNQSGKKGA